MHYHIEDKTVGSDKSRALIPKADPLVFASLEVATGCLLGLAIGLKIAGATVELHGPRDGRPGLVVFVQRADLLRDTEEAFMLSVVDCGVEHSAGSTIEQRGFSAEALARAY